MARIASIMAALALFGLALGPSVARANTPNHSNKTYTIAPLTATPLTAAMLAGTCAYTLQNNDSATIYVWFDSTASATNGISVPSAGQYEMTITYQSAQAGTTIYVYSTAGTSSNAVVIIGAC